MILKIHETINENQHDNEIHEMKNMFFSKARKV